MAQNLILALQITLAGMGLVFGAIILLWGVMALLMRLTQERNTAAAAAVAAEGPSAAEAELALKQQAAAAAIAAAFAEEAAGGPHVFPLPPTALVSPWQGVMRTKMLNKRGPVR